ncbi:MAG: bifunctional lysylphosphatidylglycerol flippase/synthetase MprF, partial [Clostridia bacterium]|nr:bifunctional lysylphosphatidylglycerol flippase/synthetase MprF [Clostridia bacterium]
TQGRSSWAPLSLAATVAIMGVLNVASAIAGPVHHLRPYRYLAGFAYPTRSLAVLAGFFLLAVAPHLARRKQVAWYLAFVLLQASVVLHLLKGLNWEEALVQMAVLEALIWHRSAFTARTDPPSLFRGIAVGVGGLAFAYVYAAAGLWLLDNQLHRRLGVLAALQEAAVLFASYPTPTLRPFTPRARWFLESVYLVAAVAVVYGLSVALRPFVYRHTRRAHDLETARAIAEAWGRSSLVYFTLHEDKMLWFEEHRRAYLAYRLVGDVALVLGDPVGPDDAVRRAIEGFTAECRRNAWTPAFLQVLPDHLDAYRASGYHVLKIGEEALVDLRCFTLAGRAWRDVRQARNKLLRLGYRVTWHEPPLDSDLLAALKAVSDAWLRTKAGPERTFSLGAFHPATVRLTPVACVRDAAGEVVAFVNLQPMYRLRQVSPDLMRHRPDAPNGTMDFLLAEVALEGRRRGLEALNLGLAPFANVGTGPEAEWAERAVRLLYERFNRFYNFRGVRRFKEKYHPRWEPRYLAYPGSAALPRIALAAVRAGSTRGLVGFLR